MSYRKFLPPNSSGVAYIIPINADGELGSDSSWGWYSKDVAGNIDPCFTITFTNDGDGNVSARSFYMAGDIVVNGGIQASSLFIGGNSNFVGDLTISGGTLFTQGLHVGSGAAIFDNSVTCNADFNHTQGYATFEGRVRSKFDTVASANDMDLNVNNTQVTGNTTINRISKTNWTPGSVIVLRFESNPTLTNGAAASGDYIGMKFDGGSFAPTANDNVVLILNPDSTFWEEVSRGAIT